MQCVSCKFPTNSFQIFSLFWHNERKLLRWVHNVFKMTLCTRSFIQKKFNIHFIKLKSYVSYLNFRLKNLIFCMFYLNKSPEKKTKKVTGCWLWKFLLLFSKQSINISTLWKTSLKNCTSSDGIMLQENCSWGST